MKFKYIIIFILSTLSTTIFAMVVSSFDKENNCTKYQVIEPQDLQQRQRIVVGEKYRYGQWGLALRGLSIDFDKKEASFELRSSNIFKFDTTIKSKIKIKSSNSQFKEVMQRVNIEQNYSKFQLIDGLCIDDGNYLNYIITKTKK